METKLISFPFIEIKSNKGNEPKFEVRSEALSFLSDLKNRKVTKQKMFNPIKVDYVKILY